jgi:tRNA dimethylallyltransferase
MPASGRRPAPPPPLAAVVGPTASGKSALAMALAERLGAEILAADSRQVYRGMDIGTAKPSATDRRRVRHHLLDLVTPDQAFSVADWLGAARGALDELRAHGGLPLVVGGTGLYVTSLVDGHRYEAQPWSPDLRRRLLDALEAEGVAALAKRLLRLDPLVAERTDLRNPRRVVRALERAELAGGPAGDTVRAEAYPGRVVVLALARPRATLYERIDERAAAIFEAGLVDEVRRLLEAGYGPELPPLTGHGYREAARYLAGEWSLDEAVAVTARRTRQYAKRQLSWFGRDRRIVWLPAGQRPANDPALVDQGLRLIRSALG